MPLADYLTGFYVQPAPDYRQTFRPGQLYFAPTFYLPAHPDVLYEVAEDPTEEHLRFEIRRMGPRSFHDIHRPLATIGLASSEELVAIKAKKRLVVLLSQENFVAEALGGRVARAAKIHERSYVCLPLYGVHRGAGERGFPPEVVVRIQALMYNQFFYFPPTLRERTSQLCTRASAVWIGSRSSTATRSRQTRCGWPFIRTSSRSSTSGSAST